MLNWSTTISLNRVRAQVQCRCGRGMIRSECFDQIINLSLCNRVSVKSGFKYGILIATNGRRNIISEESFPSDHEKQIYIKYQKDTAKKVFHFPSKSLSW